MGIYYCEIFSEKSNSVRQMWKSLGHIVNPSKKAIQNHIDKIIYEIWEINDKQEIADTMNEYFCTIGEKLASNLEGNNFQKHMTQRIHDSFSLSPTPKNEIKVEFKRLNPRKSAGADMISPKFWNIVVVTFHILLCIYSTNPWKMQHMRAIWQSPRF